MGVIYLLSEYAEEKRYVLWTIWYLAILGVGIIYFLKIHPKWIKPKSTGGHPAFLSFLGIGFGQAYNQQLGKALFFMILTPVLSNLNRSGILNLSQNQFGLIMIAVILISVIDAGRNAKTTKLRMNKHARQKELQTKVTAIRKYREGQHQFAVDTNILMHEPDVLVYLLDHDDIQLCLSKTVYNELDSLKNSTQHLTRKKAQLAFDIIEAYQRKGALQIIQTPKTEDLRKLGLSSSSDEKIIGTYLHAFHNGQPQVMFLSNDKGARIIARNVGLPVADV